MCLCLHSVSELLVSVNLHTVQDFLSVFFWCVLYFFWESVFFFFSCAWIATFTTVDSVSLQSNSTAFPSLLTWLASFEDGSGRVIDLGQEKQNTGRCILGKSLFS